MHSVVGNNIYTFLPSRIMFNIVTVIQWNLNYLYYQKDSFRSKRTAEEGRVRQHCLLMEHIIDNAYIKSVSNFSTKAFIKINTNISHTYHIVLSFQCSCRPANSSLSPATNMSINNLIRNLMRPVCRFDLNKEATVWFVVNINFRKID
jgi:hypothetical protein